MWCSDVLCHCAGSCIQWGGRLNQGRKEWSSSNPGDARGCLFFWKRPPLEKPRCGGSTYQRSPPHRWGFTSGCFHSLTDEYIKIHLNIDKKKIFRSCSLGHWFYLWIAASILFDSGCSLNFNTQQLTSFSSLVHIVHNVMSQPDVSSSCNRVRHQKGFQWWMQKQQNVLENQRWPD